MQYRKDLKNQKELSVLGYGCLRFSRKSGEIIQEKAEEEMKFAIEQGVNYFDTAYTYPGSEECLGKFLAKGYRQQVNIATKLPHYYVKKAEDMEKYFQEQLARLQTEHVEYYLMHMLNDKESWERLKRLGIENWIAEKKKLGQIESIGFSFHGGTKDFLEVLDAYDWDFCQIQYNYMDEHSQAGRRGLTYAAKKGIPVIIMEPLRGGRLTHGLPESAKKLIAQHKNGWNSAEWGLRWLWNQPEVTLILSGMNDKQQVIENIHTACQATPGSMSHEDLDTIEKIKQEINRYVKVPCTGCGYCMPCPKGVDIPVCFQSYNTSYTDSYFSGMKDYFMCHALKIKETGASQCVSCGKCKKHCPQVIDIPEELKRVKRRMENPLYQMAKFAVACKKKIFVKK